MNRQIEIIMVTVYPIILILSTILAKGIYRHNYLMKICHHPPIWGCGKTMAPS